MDIVEHSEEYLAAGVDGGVQGLGAVEADPNRRNIIRSARAEPTILIAAGGAGLGHYLEFADIGGGAVVARVDRLKQLAHYVRGLLGYRTLACGILIAEDYLAAAAVGYFIIRIGLVIEAAVAECGVCRRHFNGSCAVGKSAGRKRRKSSVLFLVKPREVEIISQKVERIINAHIVIDYPCGHGIQRLLNSVFDRDVVA